MRGSILAVLMVALAALVCACSSDGPPADEIAPDTERAAPDEQARPEVAESASPAAPPDASQESLYYATTEDLYNALQASEQQEAFTEIIDLFPDLAGEDTMWGVFVPTDHPQFEVYYYAFYTPTQTFHELVYGYVVVNTVTGERQGYFDGDADTTFDQNSMSPAIDFNAYDALATQHQDI